jgi:hypothetical protein
MRPTRSGRSTGHVQNPELTKWEAIALMLMGYFQPVTRAAPGNFLGTPKATPEKCSKM